MSRKDFIERHPFLTAAAAYIGYLTFAKRRAEKDAAAAVVRRNLPTSAQEAHEPASQEAYDAAIAAAAEETGMSEARLRELNPRWATFPTAAYEGYTGEE